MMPMDENVLGHVFGGTILSLIDKTAAVCAMRHARASAVTVSSHRGGVVPFALDAQLHAGLVSVAQGSGASLFMVLQAGLW